MGDSVCKIERMYSSNRSVSIGLSSTGPRGIESTLPEIIGYKTKTSNFATVADEVEYLTTLKGSRLVQPFGSLHGNTPAVTGVLCCSVCECAPRWWNYMGVVDGGHDNMTVIGLSVDGDRPPPE